MGGPYHAGVFAFANICEIERRREQQRHSCNRSPSSTTLPFDFNCRCEHRRNYRVAIEGGKTERVGAPAEPVDRSPSRMMFKDPRFDLLEHFHVEEADHRATPLAITIASTRGRDRQCATSRTGRIDKAAAVRFCAACPCAGRTGTC